MENIIYLTPRPIISTLNNINIKYRPIQSGICISPESNSKSNSIFDVFKVNVGTLGAIGYGTNNERIIVSNAHVISQQEFGTGWLGQNVYQPRLDCLSNNKIGNLKGYIPIYKNIDNLVDAAYATIDSSIQIKETNICGYPIGNSAEPMLNDDVYICGASTGYSEGKIIALNVKAGYINPDETITWFIDQISTDIVVEEGDSGSVLSRKSDNATLGLVFGLSPDGAVANKAINVENLLGIKFGSPQTLTDQKYTCTEGGCIPDISGSYTIQECVTVCPTEDPKRIYNKCTVIFGGLLIIGCSYYLYQKHKIKH